MVSEIGFADTLSLAQTIGIVGTMILTLYFLKRQIQALLSDQETRVLNDLDEKFHNMAMLAMQDPSIIKVIDTYGGILILYSMDVRSCLCNASKKST